MRQRLILVRRSAARVRALFNEPLLDLSLALDHRVLRTLSRSIFQVSHRLDATAATSESMRPNTAILYAGLNDLIVFQQLLQLHNLRPQQTPRGP